MDFKQSFFQSGILENSTPFFGLNARVLECTIKSPINHKWLIIFTGKVATEGFGKTAELELMSWWGPRNGEQNPNLPENCQYKIKNRTNLVQIESPLANEYVPVQGWHIWDMNDCDILSSFEVRLRLRALQTGHTVKCKECSVTAIDLTYGNSYFLDWTPIELPGMDIPLDEELLTSEFTLNRQIMVPPGNYLVSMTGEFAPNKGTIADFKIDGLLAGSVTRQLGGANTPFWQSQSLVKNVNVSEQTTFRLETKGEGLVHRSGLIAVNLDAYKV